VLVTTHEYVKAIDYYSKAVTQDPTKQLLRLELAELYLELQKYEQAERELQHLISGEAGGGEADGGGGDARGALKRWKSAGSAAMIEAASAHLLVGKTVYAV
jgi:tetratricopeptide (TPR) repeat protein